MVVGGGEAARVRDMTRAGPCSGGGGTPTAPGECGRSGRPWTYTEGSSDGAGGSTHLTRVERGTMKKRLGHPGQLVWNSAQSRCLRNMFNRTG